MWLRVKITTVFASCICLPLLAVLVAVWAFGDRVLRDQGMRELQETTRVFAEALDARLALDLTHLRTFAALPIMQDALIADSGRDIQRTLAALKTQYPDFIDLFVADARGMVVAATSDNDMGRPAATDEGFRAAASGSVHQSALTVREAEMTTAISFSVPVMAAYDRQTVVGTLSGTVDVGAIVKAMKVYSALSAKDEAVLIVRRHDRRLAFATHQDGTIAQAARSTENSGELSWRGSPYFAASANSTGKSLVRDPGFAVRGLAPAEPTLAAVEQLRVLSLAIAMIAAGAALAFAWHWATPLVAVGTAMAELVHGRDPGRIPDVAPTHVFGPMTRALETFRQSRTLHEWLSGRERELARKKELAEQALHQKSEHLASLTRALKGELTTIIELSEAINTETLAAMGPGERVSVAKDISRSGAQLLAVINDLFELSEAEAGHATLRESEADLAPLVRETAVAMREAAKKAKVTIVCHVPPTPMTARIDAQKIKQIMFNLLSNAVKFTPEEGRIDVTLKTDVNGCPAIIVADTGIGMPANLPPMAFNTGSTNTHGRHGAGLGLPLVRQLVDMHGGTFEIESETGKGTVARVTLPVSRLIAPTLEHEVLKLIA
jgi:signal transduction histidine kinase